MEKTDLRKGMIVQLNPETCENKFFKGAFMVVIDPKPFGAMGYIQCISRDYNDCGISYYRAKWEEMELCGRAEWIAE